MAASHDVHGAAAERPQPHRARPGQDGRPRVATSHRVNGVSALHTDLVRKDLFPDSEALTPGRIVNVTNGITPSRWLKLANRPLADLVTEYDRQPGGRPTSTVSPTSTTMQTTPRSSSRSATPRLAKQRFTCWLHDAHGIDVPQHAIFDVQAKRIHEYKRQLLNILWTIAHYQRISADRMPIGCRA